MVHLQQYQLGVALADALVVAVLQLLGKAQHRQLLDILITANECAVLVALLIYDRVVGA